LHKSIRKLVDKFPDEKKLLPIANLVVKTVTSWENAVARDLEDMQRQKTRIHEFVSATLEDGQTLSLKRKQLEKMSEDGRGNVKRQKLDTHLFQLYTYQSQPAKSVFRRKQHKKQDED
jgi:hypothetical protein